MSKIVKKKDLDVLIESTLKKAGIDSKKTIVESKKENKKTIVESENTIQIQENTVDSNKSLINEELVRFNKLTNYTYKK